MRELCSMVSTCTNKLTPNPPAFMCILVLPHLYIYTCDHYVELTSGSARAWTGFDRVSVRGNYEDRDTGTTDNRLDPIEIVPAWRDPFPKSNLNGKFLSLSTCKLFRQTY